MAKKHLYIETSTGDVEAETLAPEIEILADFDGGISSTVYSSADIVLESGGSI
jgi:hypothetical protein